MKPEYEQLFSDASKTCDINLENIKKFDDEIRARRAAREAAARLKPPDDPLLFRLPLLFKNWILGE